MPKSLMSEKKMSYGFFVSDEAAAMPVQLRSVGWEERTDASYDWDNRQRTEEAGNVLFQYTLSGEGRIELGKTEYALRAGDAFFITLPGDHRYYVPRDKLDSRWEFIYIMISGKQAQQHGAKIADHWGPIIRLHREARVIRHLFHIQREAAANRIRDGYVSSALAYTFLMECYRCDRDDIHHRRQHEPEAVRHAIRYAKTHYAQPIGLDELAEAAGLSKYYFSRLFQHATGTSPVQYLNRIRLEKAIERLNRTEQSVEQIGRAVGFANGNYFCKVFRKTVGTSPERFRRGRHALSVDELRFH